MATGAVRRDRTHYLYIAVIIAVALGIAVGLATPDFAVELKPLGTGFVNLIKMMISPIIFCTIVLGIGSVRKAAKVGAVGGIALGYFLVMSMVALGIGLVVGDILEPGSGLALTDAVKEAGQGQVSAEAKDTTQSGRPGDGGDRAEGADRRGPQTYAHACPTSPGIGEQRPATRAPR